jgi:beta-ureidopropionase / N-carbamoyl-L-amino-acid hydrolase
MSARASGTAGAAPISSETDIFGARIMTLADDLAQWSEMPQGLTCTYLSPAHRAVANEIEALMIGAAMEAHIDVVGNVVGRYKSRNAAAKTVIVGSHYDTVNNAGKYDGRLGILTALVVVEQLARNGQRLPFDLEVIAFSEEEGVRFSASYIGSSAIAGRFDPQILQRRDAKGLTLADALRQAGSDPDTIAALARRMDSIAGYLEVHIEQGPVLFDSDLPVGVVTAIAGNSRYSVIIEGEAGHAGAVPMTFRHDAAAAAAEMVLYVERRCNRTGLVGTVGRLAVPDGAINVIPGRCELTLDVRAGENALRQSAIADILAEIRAITQRRGVTVTITELLNAPAVPCSPRLQEAFAQSIARMGFPVHRLPSGAGHDAVMFGGLTDIAMLFVRCGNRGVSHSPREIITTNDADIAGRILLDVLQNLQP